LGFDSGFAAPGLFAASGNLHLVVTPVQTVGAPGQTITAAAVYSALPILKQQRFHLRFTTRCDGSVDGIAGSFNGACSYHASAQHSGMLYSQLMDFGNGQIPDLQEPYKFLAAAWRQWTLSQIKAIRLIFILSCRM